MTVRLPVVNSDTNGWGTLLNAFLLVAHNADGTLKSTTTTFPSGTVMLFRQAAAPTTWTRLVDATITGSALIIRTNGEVLASGGSWTVSGLTANAPVLTMNSYTPAGTVSQPVFTGDALAGHTHTFTGAALATHVHYTGIGVDSQSAATLFGVSNALISGTNLGAPDLKTGAILGAGGGAPATMYAIATSANTTTMTPAGTNSSTSGGTPTGTVSQPTLTGNAATLTGSVAAPVISSDGSWRPKYVETILASKD